MDRAIESVEQVDVRNMDREKLLTFFYNYISTGKYIERHYASVSDKLELNKIAHEKKIEELDKNYDSFYYNNLLFHVSKAEEKLNRKKRRKDKKFNIISVPSSVKSITVFVALVCLVMLGGIKVAMTVIMTILGLFLLGFIMLFIFYVIFRILCFILSPIYNLLESVAEILGLIVEKVYKSCVISIARRKDILSAKKKGITEENIKEVFKYKEIKDEINYKYNELETKIKLWNIDEKNEIEARHRQLKSKLPKGCRNLEHIIYMYNQLEVGANDNWKESINDLKSQLRHDEMKSEMRKMINNIIESNNQMARMSKEINSRFSGLDTLIASEHDRLHSRIDGFFDHLETYGYDYYYY